MQTQLLLRPAPAAPVIRLQHALAHNQRSRRPLKPLPLPRISVHRLSAGMLVGPRRETWGVIPTAMPQLDDSASLDIGSISFNSTLTKRALVKREIPPDGTGDWADYYRTLKADPNTHIIDNDAETAGTLASWVRYKWGDSPQNVIVEDLHGCEYTCLIPLRWLLTISRLQVLLSSRYHSWVSHAPDLCTKKWYSSSMSRCFFRPFLGEAQHR
jgi:hypothetical protein